MGRFAKVSLLMTAGWLATGLMTVAAVGMFMPGQGDRAIGNVNCFLCGLNLRRRAVAVQTILLVDDDAKILAPLQILLEAEGYRVLLAGDGEAGIRVTGHEHPDLIVTDWMMPVLDGIAFCRRLKSDKNTECIPVVMLTAAEPPILSEMLWNTLLRKPTPVKRLIDVIRDLLAYSLSRKLH